MIPEAAVEAAAKYLAEKFKWNGELLPVTAREILEAAAPHMLADCWDKAAQATRNVAANDYGQPWPDNPYRSKP